MYTRILIKFSGNVYNKSWNKRFHLRGLQRVFDLFIFQCCFCSYVIKPLLKCLIQSGGIVKGKRF